MNEIVESLLLQRVGLLPLLFSCDSGNKTVNRIRLGGIISPAALKNNGPIVRGILYGTNLSPKRYTYPVIKDLAGHYLHTGIRTAVSAGNSTNTDTVSVDSSNSTGNVCTVAGIPAFVAGNQWSITHEIISVHIPLVTVSIGILIGIVNLLLISPHICSQIRMTVHHSFIKNSYDNGRIPLTQIPGFSTIDIRSGNTVDIVIPIMIEVIISDIYVSPLILQERIIERIIATGTCNSLIT